MYQTIATLGRLPVQAKDSVCLFLTRPLQCSQGPHFSDSATRPATLVKYKASETPDSSQDCHPDSKMLTDSDCSEYSEELESEEDTLDFDSDDDGKKQS